MITNFIETLRFTLSLESLSDHRVNPTLNIGLNDQKNHQFLIHEGRNKLTFDEIVYHVGPNFLSVEVDQGVNNSDTHSFIIEDLKIHGISVTWNFFQCSYFPKYNDNYLASNPFAPREIKSGTVIGNRGTWRWYFNAPIYENSSMLLGLW